MDKRNEEQVLLERAKRFLGEQPEGDIEGDIDGEPTDETPPEEIEIYFDNLDEGTQKKVINGLMSVLNVTDDDQYGTEKIIEGLSKSPIFVTTADELKRRADIDV